MQIRSVTGHSKPLRHILAVAATFALGVPMQSAHAGLIGQTAACAYQGSFLVCNPGSAVIIDPGIEFTLDVVGSELFSVELNDDSLLLTFSNVGASLGLGSSNLLTLSGLSGIAGASLVFSDNPGFTAADVSFTDTSLRLDLSNTSWAPNQQALIRIASVPEPASLALLGLGLAGIAGLRRRRG